MLYLNNSATTYPKPKMVLDSVFKHLNNIPIDKSRMGGFGDDIVTKCRKNIASLFNIEKYHKFIFTSGATEGINFVLNGLNLINKHVIITTTEHNSVLRKITDLKNEKNIVVTIVKCNNNGYINPLDIENSINKNTALIFVNHVSNVTGAEQNIKKISEIAKNYKIKFAIDGSQSSGSYNIDLKKIDCDYFITTTHKSLYGIKGLGIVYIKDDYSLKPFKYGGTGVKSELISQPKIYPHYYESGTQNMPAIVALNEGINFIKKITIKKISNHKSKLIKKIYDQLKNEERVVIYNENAIKNGAQIISFTIKNIDINDISYIYFNSFDIVIRSGFHCAPLIHENIGSKEDGGTLRVSPSYFTKEKDIEYFINSTKEIIKGL